MGFANYHFPQGSKKSNRLFSSLPVHSPTHSRPQSPVSYNYNGGNIVDDLPPSYDHNYGHNYGGGFETDQHQRQGQQQSAASKLRDKTVFLVKDASSDLKDRTVEITGKTVDKVKGMMGGGSKKGGAGSQEFKQPL